MEKYPFGNITIKRSFADIGFEKMFSFDFTENGARGKLVFDNPFFYVFDKRIIMTEFNNTYTIILLMTV